MEANRVVYKCLDCGAEFEVEQGSRRKFCDKCIAKKLVGRPPKEVRQGE